MQDEFFYGVNELRKATRPHVNYVKDFERRAEKNPKACAEEALREVMTGATILRRAFKQAFGEDFEEAFTKCFYVAPERQYAVREDAPLPDNPIQQELYLLWMYWLHFYRITLDFFERCLNAPSGPHVGHARAMCACFVKHELVSYAAYLIVADEVAKRFPNQKVQQALVEQFTAFFVVYTSLHTNKRLRKAIDELREADENRFERLIKEVSGEVLPVWQEQRAAWAKEWVSQGHLMQMRSEIARRIEKRLVPQETELALFADREKLLKRGKDAGLSPREYQLFALVTGDPERFLSNGKLDHSEAAQAMGVAVGTTKSLWSRTKKKIFAA